MPVNVRLLRTEISRQADKQIHDAVRDIVKLDYNEKKKGFIEEFESDRITQELEAGPDASGSIIGASSGGNLFSLLGFYKEQKPINALREFLKRNVKLGKTRKGKIKGDIIQYETPVTIPTVDEVNAYVANDQRSSLEWTDRSFTDLIAKGITGLTHYLFDETRDFSNVPSRSGPAIQVKGKALRSGRVGKIPYIGPILANLKRRISGGR